LSAFAADLYRLRNTLHADIVAAANHLFPAK
jgi:hypothetical protein